MRKYIESDCCRLIDSLLNESNFDEYVNSMNLVWDLMRIMYETDQIDHKQYQHIKIHWFSCFRAKNGN